MAFRKILALSAALFFSVTTWANQLQLNHNYPQEYTVKSGDTLWDISGKFLRNPWQWPKLWKGNPQIQNPNLIYPGDTLHLAMVNGEPQLSLSRNSKFGRDVKVSPGIRQTLLEPEIKVIPPDAISQFLTSPDVLSNEQTLEQAPYIIASVGERLITGAGDKVYVQAIPDPKTLNYTVYRKGQAYISPETNEVLGFEAVYVATATLEKEGAPATVVINKSDREVRVGDRLMPSPNDNFTLKFFPKPPDMDIRGNIISVLNGVTQIGRYNIVVLDKGLIDGLEIGHVLDIYERGKLIRDPVTQESEEPVQLPDQLAGRLMVFRIFDRVSYALVMEANQAIHVLDKVKTP